MDGLEDARVVAAADEVDAQVVLQLVHEAQVADAQADAPGARHGAADEAVSVAAGTAAVKGVGGKGIAHFVNGRVGKAFRAVPQVVVIAGCVPADDAGDAPVQLVFQQYRGQPAAAAGGAVVVGDGAVVEVPGQAEGIEGRDLAGQAGPEGRAVAGELVAVETVIERRQVGHEIAVGDVGQVAVLRAEGIGADHAAHDPGRDAGTFKGERQHKPEKVHVIHEILLVVGRIVVAAEKIVVVGTGPEGGEAHIVIEGVAGRDAGHVGTHDLGVRGKSGQVDGLDAHAQLQIGLRNTPVDIGMLEADHVGVRSQLTACGGLAPAVLADLEVHRAGKVIGSNGIQLDAPALQGFEVVKALGIACRSVAPRHVPVLSVVEKADPSAFYFEVDSIGLRSYAKKQTGRQRYSCKFLHTSSRTLQYL